MDRPSSQAKETTPTSSQEWHSESLAVESGTSLMISSSSPQRFPAVIYLILLKDSKRHMHLLQVFSRTWPGAMH